MDVHGRDLRYFVAVAEAGSFTQAATNLYISQPALSKQIRQLEQQLGTPLLHRGANGVTLTDAGEVLLGHAREQLRLWHDAQRDIAAVIGRTTRTLTIGFSTAVARGLLAATITQFRTEQPGWDVHLRQVGWHDPLAGLGDNNIAAAILWLPLADPHRYSHHVLRTEPRYVAMSVNHRYADRETIDFNDLLDEPFLALPTTAGPLRDYWLATEHRHGHPTRIAATITGAEEAFEATAAGRGIMLLSQGNTTTYQHDEVVCLPVHGTSPCHLAIAWHRNDHTPPTAAFVTACTQIAARNSSRSFT